LRAASSFVVDAQGGGGPDQGGPGGRVGQAPQLPVLEQPVGIGLGRHEPDLEVGQAGPGQRHRQAATADGLEGDADGRQRRGVQVVHLVDQEQGAGLGALGHLADLPQQVGQVLFRVARVGHAGGGLDVERILAVSKA
jgi:hypothetical protein